LIRAQGFIEINILGSLILTGSVAFELGPTQEVTLTNSQKKTVTTMTIGAANVSAFIGVDGPYWTDLDGNQEVSWSDAEGNTLTQAQANSADGIVDVDETEELNGDAIGFHVTDLDVGIMLMAATAPADLGIYLAAKLKVNSFGLVGIDGLTATGAFDVELNVGFGLSGFEPSVNPVDFETSFSEAIALFELMDTSSDGIINETEQNVALASGYIGDDITSVAQLVSLLNTSGGPPDDYLNISEVLDKLDDSFEASNQAAIDALDLDTNGRLEGIVTDRDLCCRVLGQGRSFDTPVREVMSMTMHTVHPDADLSEVESIMRENKIRRIPVVDDDDRLRELLRKYLSENGFLVTTASDAADARRRLTSLAFDLIVLDLMMPGESGLDFAQDLRRGNSVPILMLTAMGEAEDRIA
ncbi:hypothetical protein LCGC14_2791240, partial [marine sediment metagenome]